MFGLRIGKNKHLMYLTIKINAFYIKVRCVFCFITIFSVSGTGVSS